MDLRVKSGIQERRVYLGLDPNRARGHGEANTSVEKSLAQPSRHPSRKLEARATLFVTPLSLRVR